MTGTELDYSVAGPGSLRFDDYSSQMTYSGTLDADGGFVARELFGRNDSLDDDEGDSVSCTYQSAVTHTLYLGTRYPGNGAMVSITVDGIAAGTVNLLILG